MEDRWFSVVILFRYLHRLIETLRDPRQPSNSQSYCLVDAVLGTFSVSVPSVAVVGAKKGPHFQSVLPSRRKSENRGYFCPEP